MNLCCQSSRQTKYYPSNCNKNIYITLRCVYLRIETLQCMMYICVHGDFDLPRPKELLVLSHSLNLSITCCLFSHFRSLSLLTSFVKGEAAVLSETVNKLYSTVKDIDIHKLTTQTVTSVNWAQVIFAFSHGKASENSGPLKVHVLSIFTQRETVIKRKKGEEEMGLKNRNSCSIDSNESSLRIKSTVGVQNKGAKGNVKGKAGGEKKSRYLFIKI